MESESKSSKGHCNDIIAEVEANQTDLIGVWFLFMNWMRRKVFKMKMQEFQSRIEEICHALDAASTAVIVAIIVTGDTKELKAEVAWHCNHFQSMSSQYEEIKTPHKL